MTCGSLSALAAEGIVVPCTILLYSPFTGWTIAYDPGGKDDCRLEVSVDDDVDTEVVKEGVIEPGVKPGWEVEGIRDTGEFGRSVRGGEESFWGRGIGSEEYCEYSDCEGWVGLDGPCSMGFANEVRSLAGSVSGDNSYDLCRRTGEQQGKVKRA